MEYIPINFAIIGHPLNWLIVWLMIAIAAFALDQLISFFDVAQPTNNSESA
jgi:hypothetical protein